jgi:two-component system chemotaxis response regulator CheY
MRILIVEDDPTSRQLLLSYLESFGQCDTAVDGVRALVAVAKAIKEKDPYSLICMDISMPLMDGRQALKEIRKAEHDAGIALGDGAKIVMTTGRDDPKEIMGSFRDNCEAYLIKPFRKSQLVEQLKKLGLTPK